MLDGIPVLLWNLILMMTMNTMTSTNKQPKTYHKDYSKTQAAKDFKQKIQTTSACRKTCVHLQLHWDRVCHSMTIKQRCLTTSKKIKGMKC